MNPTATLAEENNDGVDTTESGQTAYAVSSSDSPGRTIEEDSALDPEASRNSVEVPGSISSSSAPAELETDISNNPTASPEQSQAALDAACFCSEPTSPPWKSSTEETRSRGILDPCDSVSYNLWMSWFHRFLLVCWCRQRYLAWDRCQRPFCYCGYRPVQRLRRTGIQLQISVISAILAGILLEGSHVALTDVANVSLTRWSGGVVTLLLNLWRQASHSDRPTTVLHKSSILLLMTVAATLIAFSQLVTILLNRNLRLEPLAGFNVNGTVLYDFTSAAHPGSGWNTRPSLFPTLLNTANPASSKLTSKIQALIFVPSCHIHRKPADRIYTLIEASLQSSTRG